MSSQVIGLVDVVVDGSTLLSDANATLNPGGVNRSVRKGNRVVGFSEETQESELVVTVFVDGAFSVDTFRNVTNATINFVADVGQTWSIQGGWCAKPPEVDQKAGTAKITFNGPPAEEILS